MMLASIQTRGCEMTSYKAQNEPPTLRLARYLKEFVGLRTTTIRDIEQYDEFLWFGDMPQDHDCQSAAWTDDFDEDDPWLEVRKQQFEKVPAPPESAQPWVDKQALSKASHRFPPLHSTIVVPDDETVLEKDETPPLKSLSLIDHPEVSQAYERYRPRWEAWSKEHRRRKAIQRVYADLFRLHTQVLKQGEIVEVVLGLGFLDWRSKVNEKAIPIRRHVVVAQVDIEFNPDKGVIRICPPGDGARLQIEDDMLEAELRPDRTFYDIAESQLNEIGDDIWDKPQTHSMLKAWVGALNPNSQWTDSLIARESTTNDPVLSFAPALIMRKRTQIGMARIYDRLIEQLSHNNATVPKLWHGLIEDVEDSGNDIGQENGRYERADQHLDSSEVYFPLPANREQRRIVQAIDDRSGVLVQGPPGTGKSHTIVNLMCHLLANGKRLLITAETGRALRVLKEKLPVEIQPLCISLLGQGGDAFAELSKSVQGITTRQATYMPGDYKDRIDEIDQDLDNSRRRLAEIESELRSLREDETTVHSVADGIYLGTASAIAEQVAREKDKYKWLQLPREADTRPPVSNEDMISWLEIRRRYTDQQILEANKQIPSRDDVPSPTQFAASVNQEAEALKLYEQHEHMRSHEAYGPILSLPDNSREQLRSELEAVENQHHELRRQGGGWSQLAIQDLISVQQARWSTALEVSG
ncbi:MAG: AAA family ATPase, partial [Gemmatimonadetes bacterium]|nr:AAA family ATPase [Gemmatimonadota bacterium]